MHQIRDLQALEDDIRVDLAVIYSLDDPDDVTVDIDFLHLYNNFDPNDEESVQEQKQFLRSILVSFCLDYNSQHNSHTNILLFYFLSYYSLL